MSRFTAGSTKTTFPCPDDRQQPVVVVMIIVVIGEAAGPILTVTGLQGLDQWSQGGHVYLCLLRDFES